MSSSILFPMRKKTSAEDVDISTLYLKPEELPAPPDGTISQLILPKRHVSFHKHNNKKGLHNRSDSETSSFSSTLQKSNGSTHSSNANSALSSGFGSQPHDDISASQCEVDTILTNLSSSYDNKAYSKRVETANDWAQAFQSQERPSQKNSNVCNRGHSTRRQCENQAFCGTRFGVIATMLVLLCIIISALTIWTAIMWTRLSKARDTIDSMARTQNNEKPSLLSNSKFSSRLGALKTAQMILRNKIAHLEKDHQAFLGNQSVADEQRRIYEQKYKQLHKEVVHLKDSYNALRNDQIHFKNQQVRDRERIRVLEIKNEDYVDQETVREMMNLLKNQIIMNLSLVKNSSDISVEEIRVMMAKVMAKLEESSQKISPTRVQPKLKPLQTENIQEMPSTEDCYPNVNGYTELSGFMNGTNGLCQDGWILLQKREYPFKEEFNQSWSKYATGFGSTQNEFWWGLQNMYRLLTKSPYQYNLKLSMTLQNGSIQHSTYHSVKMGENSKHFALDLRGKVTGNAGDVLGVLKTKPETIFNFATFDRDVIWYWHNDDEWADTCAKKQGGCPKCYGSGWWFLSDTCATDWNLNKKWLTNSLQPKATSMKLRRKD